MFTRRRQAGDGYFGCLLWGAALIIVALICYKAIPVKIATAELYDFMVDQAKFAGGASTDVLKRSIVQKARELEIPVDDKNLTIEKIGDKIRMKTKFMIPLEFPGYTYEWNFDWEIERPIYII